MSGESASSKAATEYNNAKRMLNKALHTDDTGWCLHFVFAIAIFAKQIHFSRRTPRSVCELRKVSALSQRGHGVRKANDVVVQIDTYYTHTHTHTHRQSSHGLYPQPLPLDR